MIFAPLKENAYYNLSFCGIKSKILFKYCVKLYKINICNLIYMHCNKLYKYCLPQKQKYMEAKILINVLSSTVIELLLPSTVKLHYSLLHI